MTLKLVADAPGIDADSPGSDVNAIYEASIELSNDRKAMVGPVRFDDSDETPSLTLVWSKEYPGQQSKVGEDTTTAEEE